MELVIVMSSYTPSFKIMGIELSLCVLELRASGARGEIKCALSVCDHDALMYSESVTTLECVCSLRSGRMRSESMRSERMRSERMRSESHERRERAWSVYITAIKVSIYIRAVR